MSGVWQVFTKSEYDNKAICNICKKKYSNSGTDTTNLCSQFSKVPYEQDPLKWWSLNCTTYPFLSVLAKKYLTVQATSVASEKVFSKGGLVVTDHRALLTNDHVSELVYLSMNKAHVPKP